MQLKTKFNLGDKVRVDCGKYHNKPVIKEGVICKIQVFISDETKQIDMYSIRKNDFLTYREKQIKLIKDKVCK